MSRILLGSIAVLIILFGVYFKFTQNKIDVLTEQKSVLQTQQETLIETSKSNEKVVEELIQRQQSIAKEYARLVDEFSLIEKQRDELIEKYARHDLEFLATAKPQLIENIVNDATRDIFRCFELATGSLQTDREKNAKSPNEFNTQCQWYYEGNVE